jgi:hypothetical protein
VVLFRWLHALLVISIVVSKAQKALLGLTVDSLVSVGVFIADHTKWSEGFRLLITEQVVVAENVGYDRLPERVGLCSCGSMTAVLEATSELKCGPNARAFGGTLALCEPPVGLHSHGWLPARAGRWKDTDVSSLREQSLKQKNKHLPDTTGRWCYGAERGLVGVRRKKVHHHST